MANRKAILDKLARNLEQLGMSVSRGAANQVVVENGAADVTVTYADAVFSPTMMGGVDGSVSPFLGIGVGNPGTLVMSVAAADTLAAVFTTAIPVHVFSQLAGFANDIQVMQSNGTTLLLRVRGHADLVGMGE